MNKNLIFKMVKETFFKSAIGIGQGQWVEGGILLHLDLPSHFQEARLIMFQEWPGHGGFQIVLPNSSSSTLNS